jgi:hypothetical protein
MSYTKEFNTGTKPQYLVINSLEQQVSINDTIYTPIVTELIQNDTVKNTFTTYSRTSPSGTTYIRYSKDSNEQIYLPKSIEAGTKWETNAFGIKQQYHITSLNGTLKTPSGTYTNCMILQTINSGSITYAYIQQNNGLVGTTIEIEKQEKLMNYYIK